MVTFKTEEVCDECGSANIGYDAWVKKIGGELEIVGGPYDRCQCLNDMCSENEPHVRDVLVEDLKDCDGKDCDYHGDKGVMTKVGSTVLEDERMRLTGYEIKESYWYCSNCIVDRWSESLERIEESN